MAAGLRRPPAGRHLTVRVADLEDRPRRSISGRSARSRCAAPSVMAGYLPDEANADGFVGRLVSHRRCRLARAGGLGPPHRPVQGNDQGEGIPGGAGRDRGRAARTSRRCSIAPFSASPTRWPARCRSPPFPWIPDRRVSAAELQQLVADSLASYKRLREVLVVDEIPRLPSGKVLRRTLRDEWAPTLSDLAGGKD